MGGRTKGKPNYNNAEVKGKRFQFRTTKDIIERLVYLAEHSEYTKGMSCSRILEEAVIAYSNRLDLHGFMYDLDKNNVKYHE